MAGNTIPLSPRLTALAGVCDAPISARVHKPGFIHEAERRQVLEGRGPRFDLDVTDAFSTDSSQFTATAVALKDETV